MSNLLPTIKKPLAMTMSTDKDPHDFPQSDTAFAVRLHRPNLRQIMAGVTMDEEGCVMARKMLSGNTSDIKWNADWVQQLDRDFPKDFWKDTCYVADSAMFSGCPPGLPCVRS